MSYERRQTVQGLMRDYRVVASAGNWGSCALIVTQLDRSRLEGDLLAELIYADGYWREQQGDTDNARRCYALAAEKGHAKATRRLAALGGPVTPQPPIRNY